MVLFVEKLRSWSIAFVLVVFGVLSIGSSSLAADNDLNKLLPDDIRQAAIKIYANDAVNGLVVHKKLRPIGVISKLDLLMRHLDVPQPGPNVTGGPTIAVDPDAGTTLGVFSAIGTQICATLLGIGRIEPPHHPLAKSFPSGTPESFTSKVDPPSNTSRIPPRRRRSTTSAGGGRSATWATWMRTGTCT